MKNEIGIFKSIRTKLFLSLCIIVIAIIISLILLNNFVLRKFYEYNKEKQLENVYQTINEYYNDDSSQKNLSDELDKIAINNNFDILIRSDENVSIYSSNKDFYSAIGEMIISILREEKNQSDVLERNEKYTISKYSDSKTKINYIMLVANLDNSYHLYIRMPVTSIDESVKISNEFLSIIAIFVIIIGGTVLSVVSRRFSEPIVELNQIAKKMANLDFSQKYKSSYANDEVDMLGNSINKLSTTLEETIRQLQNNNTQLERDIEEKSQIDEMRKSFVNTMIHELKRPVQTLKMCIAFLNNKSMRTDERAMDEVVKDSMFELDNLSAYLAKVRDMTRADYEHTPLHIRTFDLRETVDKLIRLVNVPTNKKVTIHPHYEMKSTLVTADPVHIANIISNLIENAIKYSGKEVRIDLSCIQKEHTLTIQITDNGIGIPPAEQSKVFDKFYRGNHIPDRNIPGIGLGLSYVKLLTEAHHGHVSLTSQLSKGTTFSIVLPQ